jgi:hypothetical protein
MADFPLQTYSFMDVNGTISGPGLFVKFGNGTGQADEGITVEQTEDKNRMTPGASGEVMHTLIGVDAARIAIHVLKTSPLNQQLSAGFNYQKQSSLFWGINTITITNPITGDHITAAQVAFTRRPPNAWGKEPVPIVWEMEAGHLYADLGSGLVASVANSIARALI